MAKARNTPDEYARPQDDPNYQDAGQAGAAAINDAQAKREAEAAETADAAPTT